MGGWRPPSVRCSPRLTQPKGVVPVGPRRPTHEEFLENLGTAAEALKKALVEVVRFLGGKALGEV